MRESSLNHLRLAYMTKIVQTAKGQSAQPEDLGPSSNERAIRGPDPKGNDIARYKDTQASANQHFHWSTRIIWDDWTERMYADTEMASQGRVLPRPFGIIQAEMMESGAGGHRMQLHCEKGDRRPDSIWVGGLGRLPYYEAGEGDVGMA